MQMTHSAWPLFVLACAMIGGVLLLHPAVQRRCRRCSSEEGTGLVRTPSTDGLVRLSSLSLQSVAEDSTRSLSELVAPSPSEPHGAALADLVALAAAAPAHPPGVSRLQVRRNSASRSPLGV